MLMDIEFKFIQNLEYGLYFIKMNRYIFDNINFNLNHFFN